LSKIESSLSFVVLLSKMVKKEHKDLALVPESVLRKRHDLDDLRLKKQAAGDAKATKKGKGGTYVKKPNTFLAQAKNRKNQEARYLRVKKKGMMKRASDEKKIKTKEIEVEDETKSISYQANSVGAPLVFAIRTREDASTIPRLIADVLARLRLKQANQGVFLKYDATTRKLLHLVEPWVMYGHPSEGMVKDLIERRSFGNVNGQRIPISDNTILERHLGEHNIICIEDVIHEIFNVGESFDKATKFLWPFQLTSERSTFEKEKLGEKQGKDYGDKGDEIDDYIKKML
jgi:large subunit ribosomal protein L7e